MTTDGGKEGTFKKTNNDNGVFLLLHKLSFYNKWNVKLFCLIKNFISFNFFFFPGGWLLVSNVVVGNLSSLLFSYESSYHEISNYHKKSFLIGRCHEGTENTIVFHSVEIPLQQKKRTYLPFDHGCYQQWWSSSTILQWSDRCHSKSMWLVCEDEGWQLEVSCWLYSMVR